MVCPITVTRLSSHVNGCCLDINGSKRSTSGDLTSHGTKMHSQKKWILNRCTQKDKWNSGEINCTLPESWQSHSINTWAFLQFTMEHFKSHFHRWQTTQIVLPGKYCACCCLYQQEENHVDGSVQSIVFVDVLKLSDFSTVGLESCVQNNRYLATVHMSGQLNSSQLAYVRNDVSENTVATCKVYQNNPHSPRVRAFQCALP